jgi:hypothetical protein
MRLPLSAHTIYQDLLEIHRLQSVSAIGGTPFLKGLPHGKILVRPPADRQSPR